MPIDPYLAFTAYIIAGAIVAILATISGVGGGVFMVPIFYFVMGMDIVSAVGTSKALVAVITAIGAATYLYRREVDPRKAIAFMVFMIPGSIAGARIVSLLDARIVEATVGVFLIAYSVNLAYKTLKRGGDGGRSRINSRAASSAAGLIAGLVAGVTGTGGGAVLMPVLLSVAGMGIHEAVATSIFSISFSAIAAALVHVINGDVVYSVALPFMVGAVAGSIAGPKIASETKPRTLRLVIAMVLFLAGSRMLLP